MRPKSTPRLLSIVRSHIRSHNMGTKYKVTKCYFFFIFYWNEIAISRIQASKIEIMKGMNLKVKKLVLCSICSYFTKGEKSFFTSNLVSSVGWLFKKLDMCHLP
jgi:hypothetical protein